MRAGVRRRRTAAALRAALLVHRLPRWASVAMQQAYSLQLGLRVASTPLAPRGLGAAGVLPEATRRLQRRLRHTGHFAVERATIRQRARDRQRSLAAACAAAPAVVVWYDNYFLKRFSRTAGNRCVDSTVVACLPCHCAAACANWLPPRHEALRAAGPAVTREVVAVWGRALTWAQLFLTELPQSQALRVPLDVLRSAQDRCAEWHPVTVLPLACGSFAGLLGCVEHLLRHRLRTCATLPAATGAEPPRPVTPVLLDQNLWYRYLRLWYVPALRAERPLLRHHLRGCPPLLGLWHVYKHAVIVVWRFFTPLLASLHSEIIPRAARPMLAHPRLYVVERLLHALTALSERGTGFAAPRPTHPPGERARRAYLHELLTIAAPLLVRLGVMVRAHSWAATDARPRDERTEDFLGLAVAVMVRYQQGSSAVYIREGLLQLLLQRCARAQAPPPAWQEEPCEAMISVFAQRALRRDPRGAVDLRNLFRTLPARLEGGRRPQGTAPQAVAAPTVSVWLGEAIASAQLGVGVLHRLQPKQRKLVADRWELWTPPRCTSLTAERLGEYVDKGLAGLVADGELDARAAAALDAVVRRVVGGPGSPVEHVVAEVRGVRDGAPVDEDSEDSSWASSSASDSSGSGGASDED